MSWEPVNVKARLRLTCQRLGQLQEKKDSKGNITRRDIATLLQQGNVGLARDKAQNLILEDVTGDLLEMLGMHVSMILEYFSELDQSVSLSPTVVEAASSIIYAASQTESKDLHVVRDLLIRRLGPDFARSAIGNRDNYVSTRIIKLLSAPPPSAAKLNEYLANIARAYGVNWAPEPSRQEILTPLSEILDPGTSSTIDLTGLRTLCSHGIPDQPAWLRPRIWKLFFGILPVSKAKWEGEMRQQRDSYYDLIRRLLSPFSNLPPPATPLGSLDRSLMEVFKQLSRVPPSLLNGLEEEPDIASISPMDDAAPDSIRITCSANLDARLRLIQDGSLLQAPLQVTPEIRLEVDNQGSPETPLPPSENSRQKNQTTLVASKAYNAIHAHPKHASALLRLLYLHSSINPAQEIDPQDVPHIEADTFWLFEAMIGEFSELEDEEGANVWMNKFSARLSWADAELAEGLYTTGLDPALPHYSYRWLAPLLTQTLPLPSVFLVWDAIFSCPSRNREQNPKLDYLIDVCTGMLIRARAPLSRLGKSTLRSPGLWTGENNNPSTTSLQAGELGDAFLEGLSFLQHYPVDTVGGIDRLLQTAADLAQRREEEARVPKGDARSLGARLKVAMWKGFTNQNPSPELSPPEEPESSEEDTADDGHDEGDETETPRNFNSNGLTSRLANTVWRGITNQSSMEAPPSPLSPLSPAISPIPSPNPPSSPLASEITPQLTPMLPSASSIWGYAEKLKDSDTAAALAKVSSNWRAKALLGTWSQRSSNPSSPAGTPTPSSLHARTSSGRSEPTKSTDFDSNLAAERRGSMPAGDRSNVYSPPSRPAYFRPPRDSVFFQSPVAPIASAPSSPELSPSADQSFIAKTKNLQASLASLTRSQPQPAKRSGPRPLLLSTSSVVTTPVQTTRHTNPATPDRGQWADVIRSNGQHHLHRDSQSSVSSLSPSDALSRPVKLGNRSDWDSDTGTSSRIVSLNRRSVSPMAPPARKDSVKRRSLSLSSEKARRQPPQSVNDNSQSRNLDEALDSPPIGSPPPPQTPVTILARGADGVHVNGAELQRGSMVLTDPNLPLEPPSPSKRLTRKKTPPPHHQPEDTSDSSIVLAPTRTQRIRSKRYPNKPSSLRIRDNSRAGTLAERPNSLAVEWPVDQDVALTPKAATFDDGAGPVSPRSPRRLRKVSTEGTEGRLRKISTDGHDVRVRKISTDGRTRKASTDGKEVGKRTRDSAAEEGDDEGYDDLLSAYESEEIEKSKFSAFH